MVRCLELDRGPIASLAFALTRHSDLHTQKNEPMKKIHPEKNVSYTYRYGPFLSETYYNGHGQTGVAHKQGGLAR